MATTTNYSWTTPDDTALVKDGASAIRALGTAIDTSMNTALGTKKAGMVLLNTTSYTAQSSVSVSSIFNATYKNYRIVISHKNSTDADTYFRVRSASTDLTSSNYLYGVYYVGATSSIAAASANNTTAAFFYMASYGTWRGQTVIDICSPFITEVTTVNAHSTGRILNLLGGSLNNITTSYDGFTFYPSAGTMTGQVSVYGYNE